jgi:hypothetical protein
VCRTAFDAELVELCANGDRLALNANCGPALGVRCVNGMIMRGYVVSISILMCLVLAGRAGGDASRGFDFVVIDGVKIPFGQHWPIYSRGWGGAVR